MNFVWAAAVHCKWQVSRNTILARGGGTSLVPGRDCCVPWRNHGGTASRTLRWGGIVAGRSTILMRERWCKPRAWGSIAVGRGASLVLVVASP